MTTMFLARKLITVPLDKNAFEKNKDLLKSNLRKRKRAATKLKEILFQKILHKHCRLCLKPDGVKIVQVEGKFDILSSIKFLFDFEVNSADGKPQYICKSCLESLMAAVEFKELVEMTQWRLDQELELVTQHINQETSKLNISEQDTLNGGCFKIDGDRITRQWVCRVCQQAFLLQADLDLHDNTLCSEHLPYMCDECGKKTKSLHSLQKHKFLHLQVHEQERRCRFKCQFCPRGFRCNAELLQHITSHSTDRPMKCDICPAAFKSKSNLYLHKRTHAPPTFQCPHCPKAFRIRACLTNHSKAVHEKIKSIACSVCHLSFTTQRNARKHELTVHKLKKKTRDHYPLAVI